MALALPRPRVPLTAAALAARQWYEDGLGWPTIGTDPVELRTGVRFDVLEMPADAGFAVLRRFGRTGPVALCRNDLRGTAPEAPPPGRGPGSSRPDNAGDDSGSSRTGTANNGRTEDAGRIEDTGRTKEPTRTGEPGEPTPAGEPTRAEETGRSDIGSAGPGGNDLGDLNGASRGGRRDSLRFLVGVGAADELPELLEWLEWGSIELELTALGSGDSMVAPAPWPAVPGPREATSWVRPPEPGCEVEPTLPAMATAAGLGGGGGGPHMSHKGRAPDLVRLVSVAAAECHRARLLRVRNDRTGRVRK